MKIHQLFTYIVCILVLSATVSCQKDSIDILWDSSSVPQQPADKEEPQPLPENTSELWKEFLASSPNGTASRLADFSYAGYAYGEKDIPEADYPTFDVTDYGAIPDDGMSDREAFEAAIAAAQANGKGIIYFPKGRFDLRPKDAPNKSIILSGDNLILRGAGHGANGTELFMEYPNEPETAGDLWSCPPLINVRYVFNKDKEFAVDENYVDRQLAQITADAPRGSFTVEVNNTSGLYIGKRVFLQLKNNDPELVASELHPYEVQSEWTDIVNNGVQVTEYHEIARIEGNKITFKAPILYEVKSKWGWTLHEHNCHVGVGVENLAFVGNFQEQFVHHQNATHDSGFKMLTYLRQANGWVRNCRFTDVSEGLSVQKSANVSVLSCIINGNQGHSAIRSEASTRIFIGKIKDQSGQYHSNGVSKTAIGTVLYRNETLYNTCFESHSYQPRVTLVDACKGGFLPNHAGGDQASAPNHLRELVIWNYYKKSLTQEFDLWSRNNRFLLPIIVGMHGHPVSLKEEQVTINESPGRAVYPESLYEAQLRERLGYLPAWLQAVN